jgi:DNA helicase-2/ATP-dependent DNA helicase PcrA
MDFHDRPIQDRVGLPTASNYQIEIFKAIEAATQAILEGEPANSLIIDAKPGSGKTTTGVAATKLIPAELSTIFVAFNRTIANELAARLPNGIPGRTFHSHWLRQWSRHCYQKYKKSTQINKFKVQNAVDAHFGINRYKKKKNISREEKKAKAELDLKIKNVVFLVEKAKIFGVVPQNYDNARSIGEYEDCLDFWSHLSVYFDQQIEPEDLMEAIAIARKILSDGLDNDLEIDFADMLYMPAVKKVPSETYNVVMVDECQDLNSIQHYLLTRMIDRNGILIGIGDRRQSIYSFIGADSESMDNLKTAFDCREYPLSISYRCAKNIVDHAYSIYPEIEARPDAPTGSVEYPRVMQIMDFKIGDLIICRNNAPTVTLAYRLLKEKIPAKVVGRDIGKGLIQLIRRLDRDGTIPTLMERVVDWRERQFAIIDRKPGDSDRAKGTIMDKYECIEALSHADVPNVDGLCDLIDSMFTTDDEITIVSPSRVTLSTIHKIKGAEADTVYMLDAHLINAPWVKGGDWREIQEENLRFVAVTRAKTRLIYVASERIV